MAHDGLTAICFMTFSVAVVASKQVESAAFEHPSYPSTWSVKWVYIIHLSKDYPKHAAWAAYDDTVAYIIFGEGAKHVAKQQHTLIMTPENRTPFAQTRDAFSLGLRAYPFAAFFAKFNDGIHPRFSTEQIQPSSNYWGTPISSSEFKYADGKNGYVLSREAAQKLHECEDDQRDEDLALGWCMHRAGIALVYPRRLLKFHMIMGDGMGIMAFFSFKI